MAGLPRQAGINSFAEIHWEDRLMPFIGGRPNDACAFGYGVVSQ